MFQIQYLFIKNHSQFKLYFFDYAVVPVLHSKDDIVFKNNSIFTNLLQESQGWGLNVILIKKSAIKNKK